MSVVTSVSASNTILLADASNLLLYWWQHSDLIWDGSEPVFKKKKPTEQTNKKQKRQQETSHDLQTGLGTETHVTRFCSVKWKWQLLGKVSGEAFKKDRRDSSILSPAALLSFSVWKAGRVLECAAAILSAAWWNPTARIAEQEDGRVSVQLAPELVTSGNRIH